MLVGVILGDVLGQLVGVQANVGGVGIAMLLLLWATSDSRLRPLFARPSATGITFWSAMYVPIVVAMAAKQNVLAAVSSGWLALLAGVAAVAVSFAMIPLLSRLGRQNHDQS